MKLQHSAAVRYAIADHGAKDAQIVGVPGDVREQLAHGKSTLAVAANLPRRLQKAACRAFRERQRALERQRLAVIAIKERLGIERVQMRWAAVHEHEDHALGPRGKMRRLRRRRIRLSRAALFS